MKRGHDFFARRNRLLLELAERRRLARGLDEMERKRGENAANEDFSVRLLRIYKRSFRGRSNATKAKENAP